MNTSPFNIYYIYRDVLYSAEIRPCCKEDNVVDYAVWVDHLLAFTLTRQSERGRWVLAMHNADDEFDDELVQTIGAEIDKKMPQNQH
jgi:hypothetical protein